MTHPNGTIRRRNPRLQGEIGLGAAISWFAANGYGVALPLCDNYPFDLVVWNPDDGDLLRVQVKTATGKNPAGNYVARLFTAGGNQSFHTRKPFDNTASDFLFVLTDDQEVYVIPCSDIPNRNCVVLGNKWASYKQSAPN